MHSTTYTSHSARSLIWLLLVSVLLGMTGCGGCRSETPQQRQARLDAEAEQRAKEKEEEEKRKEEERKKQPFVVEAPVTKPSDTELQISRAKRGHWMTVTQLMKSNYEDWGGETTLQVVDKTGDAVPIALTPFELSSSRPVQLAKGRPRYVENVFFVPQAAGSSSVKCTLRERNYGAVVGGIPLGSPLSMMESYQYFFVVLAKEPSRYTFVKSLNGVLVPQDTLDGSEDLPHYQVLLPDISKQVPLPDNPMCWTTIAYILWDEVDPDQLDRERREALIDWLHWGGQLIVNGPDSLKLLENSFLEPYLPATDGGATEITQGDVATLEEYWTDKPRRRGALPPKNLKLTRNWSGIKLNLAEGISLETGLAASTGGLLVERRVGRGRVVVSRMQLAERELLTWSPHYDDLFNAGIMRRPPRVWSAGEYGAGLGALHGEWANAPGHIRDAQYVTHLRLFSRDVHADPDATNWQKVVDDSAAVDAWGNPINYANPSAGQEGVSRPPEIAGGIGAWNNFNATSQAAREALREAAGVQVPHRSFVVMCLAVYLVVLVPLNWFFFKALGKVEYAWIAAPIIALVGTGVVVKQAQLDIGFVRAQTEIALLEIQGAYPRAHVSRYTALYTSLSTVYDMEFADPSAVAAPFPRGLDPAGSDFKMLSGQSRTAVELTQAKNVRLAGVQVSSATTEMLHSEQMHPLDGPLTFEQTTTNQGRVVNQSQLPLRSVSVVRRVDDGDRPRLIGGWIGDLAAGSAATVSFAPLEEDPFADRRAQLISTDDTRLNLEPMFLLALDPTHIEPGDTRLVGRVDTVLPGVAVTPVAAQVRGAALVVAHLARPPFAPPPPDANSPRDVIRQYDDLGGEDFGEDFGDDFNE
jgi:hypothetical protein